jgi:hypothetical protein
MGADVLIRRAVLAVTLVGTSALSLGACRSGGGDTFTPPTHSPTTSSATGPAGSAHASRDAAVARRHLKTLCAGLLDAGTKFTAAEGAFYTNTAKQNEAAVRAIAKELQKVEGLAPHQIKAPLHDMIAGFRTFAAELANPTAQNRAKATALGKRLTDDARQVSAYATANCPAS